MGNETKHTPGPWNRKWIYGAMRHINRNVDNEAFFEGEVPEGENTPNVRINANDADLIAAAPDLLAALVDLLECDVEIIGPDAHETVKTARAAIARAEGKQS